MIFSCSLGVRVKRAFKADAMQSNVYKVIENLPLDPKTTNMDVVILGPKDASGAIASKLSAAIEKAHPDICIIYMYNKDSEKDLVPTQYKKQCKTIDNKSIQAAFSQYVEEHNIIRGKTQTSTADFEAVEGADAAPIREDLLNTEQGDHFDMSSLTHKPNVPDIGSMGINTDESAPAVTANPAAETHATESSMFAAAAEEEPVHIGKSLYETEQQTFDAGAEEIPISEEEVGGTHEVEPELDSLNIPEQEDAPTLIDKPLDTFEQKPTVALVSTPMIDARVEQFMENAANPEDWSILKERLKHDTIVQSLIADNAEYKGVMQMLEVLDKRIQAIYRDTALTPDEKFDKIKEIGLERATLRATSNSLNIERTISIISAVTVSAKQAVDYKVEAIDKAMHKIIVDRSMIEDMSEIDRAIEERTKVMANLLNLSRDIVDLFKSINSLACDEIEQLDKQLPSANAFINSMVRPIGTEIFTPANTAALANKMMTALRSNAITVSQVEEQVNSLIKYMFDLFDKDEELIKYQRDKINLLRSNRVENLVTATTLLKKVTRLFVGADNTGKTATALTWSGILSRRQNVILLDMSNEPRLRDYGVQTVTVDDFLKEPIHTELLCVEVGNKLSATELQTLMETVNSRLSYYSHVNIIVSATDVSLLNQLLPDAIAIHFITDCSAMSMAALKNVTNSVQLTNIAIKLVTIDAPVSPLTIATNIGIDATMCQYVPIPRVTNIRACAIRHDRPYEHRDIRKVFEEAFN